MPRFHLAQINAAQAGLDDPSMAGFAAQLGAIKAPADRSPGSVWRRQAESVEDDLAGLDQPARHGLTLHAFALRSSFPAPDGTAFGLGGKQAGAAQCA